MKRKILLSLFIIVCLLTVGCGKKENKNVLKLKDGWEIDLSAKEVEMPSEAKDIFNRANDKNYEVIALLGTQVVAGTNYMFLVKDDTSYKIIVVYNNLEDKATIIHTNNFDFTKYVNERIDYNSSDNVGGWEVYEQPVNYLQNEKVQQIFDDATATMDIVCSPIALLGQQEKSGTNYAILTYCGDDSSVAHQIDLFTVYEDLHGTRQIVSSAYVNLSEYNK